MGLHSEQLLMCQFLHPRLLSQQPSPCVWQRCLHLAGCWGVLVLAVTSTCALHPTAVLHPGPEHNAGRQHPGPLGQPKGEC